MIGLAKRLWIRRDVRPDGPLQPTHSMVMPLPARWQCDLSDDSLTWSPGVFELFGIPEGARLDRRAIVEQFVDESREILDRVRTKAIAEAGSFTFDAKIRRLDGELRWMRITADIVVSGGRVTHLYGQKQDITAAVAEIAA